MQHRICWWEWFRGVVDKYLVREIITTIPLKKKTPHKTFLFFSEWKCTHQARSTTACIAFLNANHLETLHQCGIFLDDWNLFLGVSATILGPSAEDSHTRWASIIFVHVLFWYPRSSPAIVSLIRLHACQKSFSLNTPWLLRLHSSPPRSNCQPMYAVPLFFYYMIFYWSFVLTSNTNSF